MTDEEYDVMIDEMMSWLAIVFKHHAGRNLDHDEYGIVSDRLDNLFEGLVQLESDDE